MANNNLEAKEFNLIQEIAKSPGSTQRELSNNTGLSLGMTNLLLKRLARKGLIKVKALDWNRMQYLLTLKGAMEKASKSYHYSLYTVRIFRQIERNISVALRREYDAGRRDFAVVAQDEILDLVKDIVADLGIADARFLFVNRFEDLPPSTPLVLVAVPAPYPAPKNGTRHIRLVDFDDIDFRVEA